jgi:hypothetical protein
MQKTLTVKKTSIKHYGVNDLWDAYDTPQTFYLHKQGDTLRVAPTKLSGFETVAHGTRGKILDTLDTVTRSLEGARTLPCKGKAGRIVRSGRLFGAELELTRGRTLLSRVPLQAQGFELKRDGSVNGDSLELTTPPLSGTSAEYVFANVVTPALVDSKTDTSCGLHVHVDARDYKTLASKGKHAPIVRLTALYMALQPFMLSLVPLSRRSNTYCKTMNSARHLERLAGALDTKDTDTVRSAFDYVVSHVCASDRYQWYNLVPWFREGHYEVRLHSGTHDTRKVLEWANLHTLLADGAMQKWFTTDDMRTMHSQGSLKTLDLLAERLRLTPASVTYWRGRISRFNV